MFEKIKMKRKLNEVKKLEEEVRKLKGGKPAKEMAEKTPNIVKDDLKKLDMGVSGKYITKDLKMSWVAVFIIAIVIIVGLTIFSQWKFKQINSNFDSKVAELQKTYQTLQDKESKLNQTSQELVLKTARESSLSGQYEEVSRQRDDYKKETEDLKAKNSDLVSQLDTANKEINNLQAQIAVLQKQIADLKK